MTRATASSPSRPTSTVIVPPLSCIACFAFEIRLRKICLSWFGARLDVDIGSSPMRSTISISFAALVRRISSTVCATTSSSEIRLELVRALAREVEQRADDLLDLERRSLDQLEAIVRLRAGLGVLEQELDEAEDREERVVDLVRDACRELADRRELAALDQPLLEAPAFALVGDQHDGGCGHAVGVADHGLRDLRGDELAGLAAEEPFVRSWSASACAGIRPPVNQG